MYKQNTFNIGVKQKAFIVLQDGFNNLHKDEWEVSFTHRKGKYYFKSYDTAVLFIEVNSKANRHINSGGTKGTLTKD